MVFLSLNPGFVEKTKLTAFSSRRRRPGDSTIQALVLQERLAHTERT